ncbi:KAP family P-loop NTPase fold protein [Undibacterium danionis]|uniref:P-loop NTPase fold protein n=1 Tax=Undibacterium danionis TaxID=1812100 RepID=A0ABV6IC05_9BURK
MNSIESDVEEISASELKNRLRAVIKRDKYGHALVSLFAARCALRILPSLVSGYPSLDYWATRDKGDKRITYLLGIWWAIACGVSFDRKSSNRAALIATEAAEAIDIDNDDDDPDDTTLNDAVYVAVCATYTAVAAYSDNAGIDADSIVDLLNTAEFAANLVDLEYIEKNSITIEEYLGQRLWLTTFGSELEVSAIDIWPKALRQIASEFHDIDSQGARLVIEIADAYPRIVNGTYKLRDAEKNVQELAAYFNVTPKAQKTSQTSRRKAKSVSSQSESFASPTSLIEDAVQAENVDEQKAIPSETKTPEDPLIKNRASQHVLPEAPSQEDHLNRGALTRALAAILAHEKNHSHQTIGLLGDWGSGKSSFIKSLQAQLRDQPGDQAFIFGTFNAWSYEHTPNLQAGITQEVIKALLEIPLPLARLKWWQLGAVPRWMWQFYLKLRVAFALHGAVKVGMLLARFVVATLPLIAILFFYNELIPLLPKAPTVDIQSKDNSSQIFAMLSELSNVKDFLKHSLLVGAGAASSIYMMSKLFVDEFKNIIATPLADKLKTYLKLPDYAKHLGEIPEMRVTLEKFCKVRLGQVQIKPQTQHLFGLTKPIKPPERLLFVIDDLDRCSPEGIVKVFEAVRLVLEIPQVSVLIAVDPKIALAALALHFEKVSKHHAFNNANAIARDYLAKVIHIPIVLAQPDPDGIQLFVEKLWERTLSESDKKFLENHSGEIQKQAMLSLDKTSAVSSEGGRPQVALKLPTESSSIEKKEIDSPQLEMDATLNSDIKTEAKTLTKKDEVTKEVKLTLVASLSRTQKSAFVHWLKYFGLTNPRQVKRLNTTYNLMLTANENWDEKPIDVDVGVAMPNMDNAHYYPVLITLFVLEYLNGLDAQRTPLKKRLFNPSANTCVNTVVTEEFIQFFSQLRLQRDYLKLVEPFVLPAIELAEIQA